MSHDRKAASGGRFGKAEPSAADSDQPGEPDAVEKPGGCEELGLPEDRESGEDLDAFDLEALDRPIELPITDVLDLHSFRPAEVADIVREYLHAAAAKGLKDLRIIHGKRIGVQRRTVRILLERDPSVVAFGVAPTEAGGWGATWVRLR